LTKICEKNSSLVKVGHREEALYVRMCVRLWLLWLLALIIVAFVPMVTCG